MKLWLITGSATEDGAPIYLQTSGRWTHKLAAGYPITTQAERDQLLEVARGQQRAVCDPYAIEVRRGSLGHLAPLSLKETIRAAGPTIAVVGTPLVDDRPAAASA